MPEFCDYLEEITVKCHLCVENSMAACHIKLGFQEYFPKDFSLWDTIQIIRHDTRLSVDTDIQVKYETKFPGGTPPGKFAEWERELTMKAGKVKEYLEPRLPPGVSPGTLHVHYHPDKYNPNIVAMHIHAHRLVEDLDEAKDIVQKLAKTIKPGEIEAAIR